MKELESRAGMPDESLGEMRILSLKGWPAHDLLLLVRDDFSTPINNEIDGVFGIYYNNLYEVLSMFRNLKNSKNRL